MTGLEKAVAALRENPTVATKHQAAQSMSSAWSALSDAQVVSHGRVTDPSHEPLVDRVRRAQLELSQVDSSPGELSDDEDDLLRQVAEGRPLKAIAATRQTTAAAVNDQVEAVLLKLAQGASAGRDGALKRLRMLQSAIVDREEQGETLSRFLPGGLAEKLRTDAGAVERTERLTVTVLMSDVRGYSTIAEYADPTVLAGQLRVHRREMNYAILEQEGTVMQYVGDAVMAVFGAPLPQDDHADRALAAATAMHERQAAVNARWADEDLAAFGLGIGLSTGEVAAALLGSDERLEYTLVGDTVNLAQRLEGLARPAGTTVLSEATALALSARPDLEPLPTQTVKGRATPVTAFRFGPSEGTAP